MNSIELQEFVRRIKELVNDTESRFSLFLGAGCSISSGIAGAGTLVKNWLPRLKKLKTGGEDNVEEWAREVFSKYDHVYPALLYGEIIEELFLTPQERQREIERLIEEKDPGIGYAVLAQVLSNRDYGKHFNVVLTTNFDDMVADALYLYTNKKPLVISHESLVGFVKISRTRPLVIKLHGDARLTPRNTKFETQELNDEVKRVIRNLLAETGLIFVGYGANDKSIVNILSELPQEALPWGIYWVNNKIPDNEMGKWLRSRNAVWINHLDFDELMLLIFSEFELKEPDWKRFDRLSTSYLESFKKLQDKVIAQPNPYKRTILAEAVEKAVSKSESWLSVALEAHNYAKTNPEKADQIFQEGLKAFHDASLLNDYALFLHDIRKDYDRAEKYYKRAIEADPNNVISLGNYALFLHDIHKDYGKAEEYYKRAIEVDPNDATNLGNYANFLANIRKNHVMAEEYLQRAIEIDPNNAMNLGNYALFLHDIHKDYGKAEEYYKRAIEADANNAMNLGNYAIFLKNIRKDYDKAEEYYKRAIEADPNHAGSLGNYANFLQNIRKNYEMAEEYYKRSVEANPNKANNLGNYAGFLLAQGRYEEGFKFLNRALSLADNNQTLILECLFYQYAHDKDEDSRKNSLSKIKELIKSGVSSPGWNLKDNVERAIKDGHPYPQVLEDLAGVISDEANAKDIWTDN